jgi:hypothetical protein
MSRTYRKTPSHCAMMRRPATTAEKRMLVGLQADFRAGEYSDLDMGNISKPNRANRYLPSFWDDVNCSAAHDRWNLK